MLTREKIKDMFKEMGLGTKQQRAHFTEMMPKARLHQVDGDVALSRLSGTTGKEESEDAELARDFR